MKNKKVRIDQFEIKGKPERRVKKQLSHFESSLVHLMTFLGFIGALSLFFLVSYFGVQGGVNEVARQGCESLQAYVSDFPDSVVQGEQITRCGVLGVEIE